MTGVHPLQLVWPAPQYLSGYTAALRQGWSPNTHRPEFALTQLEQIARDADTFLAEQVDPEAKGPPIELSDGTTVPRLPGFHRWLWDGEFCGSIGLRWRPGTAELPPHVLGHIGYSVVPWKQRRGYATRALKLFLADASETGLPFVELVTDADNRPSQQVIEANGGKLVERFRIPESHGGGDGLRFRIVIGKRASSGARHE